MHSDPVSLRLYLRWIQVANPPWYPTAQRWYIAVTDFFGIYASYFMGPNTKCDPEGVYAFVVALPPGAPAGFATLQVEVLYYDHDFTI